MSLSDMERSRKLSDKKNHTVNIFFKWKQTPYPVYFLKRYTIIVAHYHKWNLLSQYLVRQENDKKNMF